MSDRSSNYCRRLRRNREYTSHRRDLFEQDVARRTRSPSRHRSRSHLRTSKTSFEASSTTRRSLSPLHHRKLRRVLVSESSDSNSEEELERRRPNSIRNTTPQLDIRTNKGEPTFTAQEIISLIKALPSTSLQNHFSMTSNAIPEFDPANKEQTIDTWLIKVEECSKLYNWSETQLLHYTLPKLTGVAKVWYQGLPSVNYTWNEWKKNYIKLFQPSKTMHIFYMKC